MTAAAESILIVDDVESSRYSKARWLRLASFEVLEADCGKRALELIESHRPRLVVCDVNLPDIDGLELCRLIKQGPETAATLVLQVSATYVTQQDTVRALEHGADASLVEPIDAAVLVATVKALLRSREAEDRLRNALVLEQNARGAAESANRVKDEFLATLSHELRSPLGAILTWVTLLQSEAVDADLLARGLAAIERNTRLQVSLIEDLLDTSRIISGKMQLELGRVDLKAVVASAIDAIAPVADAKRVAIHPHVDPRLPPISGDSSRLYQVISNLLSNAIKFTPSLGRAELFVEQSADGVEIRVSDTGRGIAPEFLPHVFERFQQADSSTTRPESGLGLGLAIVRHLVELHGGTVHAHSTGRDHGATFTVRLPMNAGLHGNASEPVAVLPKASGAEQLVGARVLVVDDNADAREAIVEALRNAGAVVSSVDGVGDALAHVDRSETDVVISDIAMPIEDGYSLIRRLRSRPRGKRIAALALTAFASTDDQRSALAAGYDGFLAKPAASRDLIATVARLSQLVGNEDGGERGRSSG